MTKRVKKTLTKLTAILLTLSFGLMCIPESVRNVFAQELQSATTKTEETIDLPKDEFAYNAKDFQESEVYVVSENLSMRTATRKFYDLSNGTVLIDNYSTAIHYFNNESGRYEEIDNTLTLQNDGVSEYYTNRANSYRIKLYKQARIGKKYLELNKEGYNLSFEPVLEATLESGLTAGRQTATVTQSETTDIAVQGVSECAREEFDYSAKNVTTPQYEPSIISEASYTGIYPHTMLKYLVGSERTEQVITVLEKSNSSAYTLKVNSNGISLRLNEDGTITAHSKAYEIFKFSAPLITDSNGVTTNLINYIVQTTETESYITLTVDKDWLNSSERVFPVKIKTNIFECESRNENNGFQSNGDTATYISDSGVLNLNANESVNLRMNTKIPSYIAVTSATLEYTYHTNNLLPMLSVSRITNEQGASNGLTVKNVKTTQHALNAYTKTESVSLKTTNVKNLTFEFRTNAQSGATQLYADGANAAVLSVTGVYSTGLGPNTVTEQFGGDGITHYANVLNGNLTSVIDLMSINSNVMPIGLQLVYNSTKFADNDEFTFFNASQCFENGFKLNVEQYLTVLDSTITYIDGSNAVHKFTQNTVKNGTAYYLGSDCNLMCRTDPNYSDTARYILYKNDVPYMYFKDGRLRCIAESGKYLHIEYSEPSLQITKVSNCLDGTGDFYNIGNRAQYVNFEYDSASRLKTLTSNYGDSVGFEYKTVKNASNANVSVLAGIKSNSDYFAKIFYNTNIIVESIIDKQNLGYDFTSFNNDGAIDTIVAVGTDVTTNLSVGSEYDTIDGLGGFNKASLDFYQTEKKVWFFSSGTQLTHSYAFDDNGRCISSYSGYSNSQSKSMPKNSVALYSYGESGNLRSRSAFSYTEDFTQLNNGDFETLTENTPSGWMVTTTNTGNNYISRQSGKALLLTRNSSAEQNYSFNNVYSTTYALGFIAQSSSGNVTLRLDWYGYDDDDAVYFTISESERYYGMILCDRSTTGMTASLRFTNVGTGSDVYIDNVTISPVDNYVETSWDKTTFFQTSKQISDTETSTTQANAKNQVTASTAINHPLSTITTTTYTYNEDNPYNVVATSVVTKGTSTISTKTVTTTGSATNTQVGTVYTDSKGTNLRTFSQSENNMYGLSVKEIGTNGEKTYYFYDVVANNLRLTKKISCNSNETLAVNTEHEGHINDYVLAYTYNNNGELVSVSDGANATTVTDYHNANAAFYQGSGQSWKTDTDKYGNTTAIYEQGNNLKQIQYTYNSTYGQLTRVDYNHSSSNYSYANYTYDTYGNLIYENWHNSSASSDTYSYVYDYANNAYTEVSNGVSYSYKGNITKNSSGGSMYLNSNLATQSIVTVSGNGYNANYTYKTAQNGYLSNYVYNINGTTYTYSPTYNDLGQVATEYNGTAFTSSGDRV